MLIPSNLANIFFMMMSNRGMEELFLPQNFRPDGASLTGQPQFQERFTGMRF